VVRISVIVPVYNDPGGVVTTVDSLAAQSYPPAEHEIIVVDNDSTDGTRRAAVEALADVENGRVVDETDVQSSYAARNAGIEHAVGDLLAFVDADMTVESSWLADVRAFVERTGADYVGCDVRVHVPEGADGIVGRFNAALGFPVQFYLEEQRFAPTCCLTVRRAVVDDVGPFDERLVSSGDLEFGRRVAAAGYAQRFAPEITMYHPARTSVSALTAKATRVGRGKQQLRRLYPDLVDARSAADVRNVLPPHPGQFVRRLTTDPSRPALVAFYLLAYYYKLAMFRGRLEAVFESSRRTESG
jgi:glycosyltransferase involved in cell wall biosynthesis